MISRREQLQKILEEILGSENVYFQPPSTVRMSYPAIIYSRSSVDTDYANDKIYRKKDAYTVTIVDSNPDSAIPRRLLENFEYCGFDRHYTAENLNHDVFTLFF